MSGELPAIHGSGKRPDPVSVEACIYRIIDAHDRYGLLSRLNKEEKLKRAFLLRKEDSQGVGGTLCGVDVGPVRNQATIFFQALAMSLDLRTGTPVCSIVELDEEGFGRAVLYSGRLVLAAQAWRQGQFGFTSLEDACFEGERIISIGMEWVEKYRELSRLG